jgi:hypothetical protein
VSGGDRLFATLVPIIVCIISGLFVYWQAKKVAEKNAESASKETAAKNREIDQAGMAELNRSLRLEIDRLREDRAEDENRHREDMQRHEQRHTDEMREVTEKVAALNTALRREIAWSRQVIQILRLPPIRAALAAADLSVPPPPLNDQIGDDP